jgi:acetyl esterase/lipase
MKTGALTLLCVASLLGAEAFATEIALWPEGVPNLRSDLGPEQVEEGRVTHVTTPTLFHRSPTAGTANGTAVILCPGGGYGSLSLDFEGTTYATWLSQLGVTTFVLKYRLREYGHPAPLQDVLRAVRLVRSRAVEFGINPERIGVMGSSAGGHLAASAGTLFDQPAGRTGAPLDAVSGRPDFLILMYPVISMTSAATHAGSRSALLGTAPSPELLRLMSLELQVTSATPPTLLIHTQEDTAVPIENSILFFQALTRVGVPAEFYAFEHGPHGIGMNPGHGTASDWPHRAEEWLRARGLLDPPKN